MEYFWKVLSTLGVAGRQVSKPVFASALLLGVAVLSVRRSSLFVLSVVTILAPVALVALLKPAGYADRYLAPSLPYILLILTSAVGLVALPLKLLRRDSVATFAPLALAALLVVTAGSQAPRRPDWRGLAEFLRERVIPGDVVILVQDQVRVDQLRRYLGYPEGVAVLRHTLLLHEKAATDTFRTRWWVAILPQSGVRDLKGQLSDEFQRHEPDDPAFLVVSRGGPATRLQCCRETGGILEPFTTISSRWQLPTFTALRWAHVGGFYLGFRDTVSARSCYLEAVRLDSACALALKGFARMEQQGR